MFEEKEGSRVVLCRKQGDNFFRRKRLLSHVRCCWSSLQQVFLMLFNAELCRLCYINVRCNERVFVRR